MKRCSACKEWKALSEFNKCSAKKDGLHSWCRECNRANSKRHSVENSEKAVKRAVAWNRTNRERRSIISIDYEGRKRAKKYGAAVDTVDYDLILQRDGQVCYLCGGEVSREERSFDHVVPLVKGGAHSTDNIRLAHLSCNVKKGAALPCPR